MNTELTSLFSFYYNEKVLGPSPALYFSRTPKLLALFQQYNIKSVFDSGCRDMDWIKDIVSQVDYTGGDISPHMVALCNKQYPSVNVVLHDATSDPFPAVDLIISSDVLIHLNTSNKRKFFDNFLASSAQYLLITDDEFSTENSEVSGDLPFADVNWKLAPWNFPQELASISDVNNDKRLKLWSREQIKQAVSKI